MKLNKNHVILGAVIFVLFLLNFWLTADSKNIGGDPSTWGPPSSGTGGKWSVYGTTKCGWTNKQLEHMKSNGINHEFIDCSKDRSKCKGMDGFPTLRHSGTGKEIVGYTTTGL